MLRRLLLPALALGALVATLACADARASEVREIELTAEVVDWEVVDGEIVEVWGYNGQYPGPLIEGVVGETLRVTLTNNLPEGTTIHWHGLEVPNEQDGVPGITQPLIEPGERFTYEFKLEQAGTTMYHTHANTVRQLSRGLVGPLVVREQDESRYDAEYTMVLHEIGGLFTINGHSFPATLEDENTFIQVEEGDRIRVRFINAGQQHHPMHLHGHQFRVVALDSNELARPYQANTVDVAPGQTVDVVVNADNPGTWTFHCHILPHVTNKGAYPGGMLTLVDYVDHESYMEQRAAEHASADGASEQDEDAEATPTTAAASPTTATSASDETAADAAPDGERLTVVSTEFAFDPAVIEVAAGSELTLELDNRGGGALHNLEIPDLGVLVEAEGGERASVPLAVPSTPGDYVFICNIPGHRELGMEGVLRVIGP